jgi:hypothetical protein
MYLVSVCKKEKKNSVCAYYKIPWLRLPYWVFEQHCAGGVFDLVFTFSLL